MKKLFSLMVIIFIFNGISFSQFPGGGEAYPDLRTDEVALNNWREMRFGMFIHWGSVTLRGTEIGWSRGRQVPVKEYDNLYKEFNPVLFNAEEWVGVAKEAGMKYLVITAKHHDGFCLWDSKYTDYDIMSTPFRRDVLKELSDECRRQNIMFCTYYSIIDWHHPDYIPRGKGDGRPAEKADFKNYIEYMKNQLAEIIKNYNPGILWFDGYWEKTWTHSAGMELYSFVRKLKSNILINNRVDVGRGKDGMTKLSKFAGDFGTPEQKIGNFNRGQPWETCMTLCKQWAWKPNDKMKSLKQCIQTLVRTAGGDGNLLLNVGPMLDGRIEQRQVNQLKEIGYWLKKNGESIYGTRGGPFMPDERLASTSKRNLIYLHLLNLSDNKLELPSIRNRKILKGYLLNGKKVKVVQSDEKITVVVPENSIDIIDTIVVLELDGPATNISPVNIKK